MNRLAIAILIIVVCLIHPANAQYSSAPYGSSPWNGSAWHTAQPTVPCSWLHRRLFQIDNTARTDTVLDYNIRINLDSASFPTGARSDLGDLRFVGKRDSTDYSFWRMTVNRSARTAVFWVKIDTLFPARDSLWMYSGSATAADHSSIENTFLFGSDFSNTHETNPRSTWSNFDNLNPASCKPQIQFGDTTKTACYLWAASNPITVGDSAVALFMASDKSDDGPTRSRLYLGKTGNLDSVWSVRQTPVIGDSAVYQVWNPSLITWGDSVYCYGLLDSLTVPDTLRLAVLASAKTDLITWTAPQILLHPQSGGSPANWENLSIQGVAALADSPRVHLYYTANSSASVFYRIGLATSVGPRGTPVRYAATNTPVVPLGTNLADSTNLVHSVIRSGSRIVLSYSRTSDIGTFAAVANRPDTVFSLLVNPDSKSGSNCYARAWTTLGTFKGVDFGLTWQRREMQIAGCFVTYPRKRNSEVFGLGWQVADRGTHDTVRTSTFDDTLYAHGDIKVAGGFATIAPVHSTRHPFSWPNSTALRTASTWSGGTALMLRQKLVINKEIARGLMQAEVSFGAGRPVETNVLSPTGNLIKNDWEGMGQDSGNVWWPNAILPTVGDSRILEIRGTRLLQYGAFSATAALMESLAVHEFRYPAVTAPTDASPYAPSWLINDTVRVTSADTNTVLFPLAKHWMLSSGEDAEANYGVGSSRVIDWMAVRKYHYPEPTITAAGCYDSLGNPVNCPPVRLVIGIADTSKTRDATIDSTAANQNTNYGAETSNIIGTTSGSNPRDYVFYADISAVPAGATIVSDSLYLWLYQVDNGPVNFGVHRITRAWTEGGVTWLSPWIAAGGDYIASPLSSRTVSAADVGAGGYIGLNLTAAYGQAQVNGTANCGVIIRQESSRTSPSTRVSNRKKEFAGTGSRPYRVITYTVPTAP